MSRLSSIVIALLAFCSFSAFSSDRDSINNTYQLVRELPDGYRYSVVFSPDGSMIGSTGAIVDAEHGNVIHRFNECETGAGAAILFSPDNKFFACSYNNSKSYDINVWDVQTGALVKKFDGHADSIGAIAFSKDGTYIASGSRDQIVKIWNFKTDLLEETLVGDSGGVISLDFSPDNSFIVSGTTKGIQLWDLKSSSKKWKSSDELGWTRATRFSPDARYLTAISYGTMRSFDVESGSEVNNLEIELVGKGRTMPSTCELSSDAKLIAAGSWAYGHDANHSLEIWSVDSRRRLKVLGARFMAVEGLAFSPDSTKIAATINFGKLQIWNVSAAANHQESEPETEEEIDFNFGKFLIKFGQENGLNWNPSNLNNVVQILFYGKTFCPGCSMCSSDCSSGCSSQPYLNPNSGLLKKFTFQKIKEVMEKSPSYSGWVSENEKNLPWLYDMATWCSYGETHPEEFAQLEIDSALPRKLREEKRERRRIENQQVENERDFVQGINKWLKNGVSASVIKMKISNKNEFISIDSRGSGGRTILMNAVYYGRLDVVKMLIEEFGADWKGQLNELKEEQQFASNSKRNDFAKVEEYLYALNKY